MEVIIKISPILWLTAASANSGATGIWAALDHSDGASNNHGYDHGAHATRLLMLIMVRNRSATLFVEKGCVACHSVNRVVGHDSSAFDAHDMDEYMILFHPAAKMCRYVGSAGHFLYI